MSGSSTPATINLQTVVDALFAFAESCLGKRPLVLNVLRLANEEIDAVGLPALAAYLQSVGLGWILQGPVQAPAPPAPGSPTSGPVPTRVIHLINQSTVVSAADFAAAAAALQRQVNEHFAPLWSGLGCELVIDSAPPGQPVTPTVETIFVLDNSDQAGALGYHTLTQGDLPVGFCFAKTSLADNSPWQVTLSHELLEQLADPYVQTAVVVASFKGKPAALAYETGDPVEADSYQIDGVAVSNFVTPAWFQDSAPPGTKLDYLGKLTAPLTLTPGGYVAYTTDLTNWQQYMSRGVRASKQRVCPWSRRGKRARQAMPPATMRTRDAGSARQGPERRIVPSRPGLSLAALRGARRLGLSVPQVLSWIEQHGPEMLQVLEDVLILVGGVTPPAA